MKKTRSKIIVNSRAIHLFYDTVHIVKNLRNNMLHRKRFSFPPFSCSDLCERITVAVLHEEEEKCQANLRAASSLFSRSPMYVLTAKFQSDPLERRYGQYSHMSGGWFLVSLKDVSQSENILEIKTLVKECFNVTQSLKVQEDYSHAEENLFPDVVQCLDDNRRIRFRPSSNVIG